MGKEPHLLLRLSRAKRSPERQPQKSGEWSISWYGSRCLRNKAENHRTAQIVAITFPVTVDWIVESWWNMDQYTSPLVLQHKDHWRPMVMCAKLSDATTVACNWNWKPIVVGYMFMSTLWSSHHSKSKVNPPSVWSLPIYALLVWEWFQSPNWNPFCQELKTGSESL